MLSRYFVIPAVLALASPAALYAGEGNNQQVGASAPAPEAAPEPDESDLNKKICKSFKKTGSRVTSKSVCKTKREWLAGKAENQQAIERLQVTQKMRQDND